MASKIIVVGGVNGQLRSLFTKLTTLHAKNNFSLAIITGDLFDENEDEQVVTDILGENIVIPFPTYFTVGTRPLPEIIVAKLSKEEDLCTNLHYLGKRSTTKTSEGVRIVTLGGQLDEKILGGVSQEQYLPFHTADDAKALRGANTADILLTTAWPTSIRTGSKVTIPEGVVEPASYEHIADLCAALKPRYHFSSSPDWFYEREPFFHTPTQDAPNNKPVTRFISLAAHGNPSKQKSLYAFTLQASADVSSPLPAGATASPFFARANKRRALDPAPYSRFSTDGNGNHHHKRRKERAPPPGPDQCFFCLSNPNLATHLVASIGEDAYLTIAKGPLTTSKTNAPMGLNYPAHILIIPLNHEPTIGLIEPDSRTKSFDEMDRYKSALQSMVASRSSNMLGAVTYEVSRAGGVHIHWQFLPMPASQIRKGLVEAAFRVEAENLSYPPFEARDPGVADNEGDFFRVWIWSPADDEDGTGALAKCLTLPLPDGFRFDLQFGRRVLAKLLGLEKRLQWRDCAQSEDEEKSDVEAFKEAFKKHDFTLEG